MELGQVECLRDRFLKFVEDGDPHPAALGQRKDGQSKRPPSSERAAEGVGFAWSLLHRGRDRWKRLSGCAQPRRLGTLRSFRCSMALAGYSALRFPTVTCSLLHIPPGLPAPACKLAVTALASGQPEGGPTYDSYRCKAQRLISVCLAQGL